MNRRATDRIDALEKFAVMATADSTANLQLATAIDAAWRLRAAEHTEVLNSHLRRIELLEERVNNGIRKREELRSQVDRLEGQLSTLHKAMAGVAQLVEAKMAELDRIIAEETKPKPSGATMRGVEIPAHLMERAQRAQDKAAGK